LPTGDGAVSAGDGILQAAHGDTFTVSYTDADDGNGNSFTVSASADIENVVVHHSEDTPTQIIDNRTITSTITVSDLGTLLDVDLQLDITHSFVGDLTAVLTAPNGNGDNFTQTMFDDDATIAIGDGTAPFTGTFRGVDAFASLNGTSMTGDWVLSITDSQSVDQGTLNGWSLFLAVEPENLIETPEVVINASSVARSVIDEVVVSFDSIVNVGAGAFELIKRGPSGGIVDVTPVVDNSSGSTVVTLEFSGAFTGAAGLIDGNYQLTVSSDLITSSSGTPMDGDGDGVPGGDLVFGDTASDRFFRFFGDNNGDRSVNLFDLLAFRQTWGSSDGDAAFNGQFDSNADGTINVFDLLAFRNNYAETFDFV
jgi:subtilisin-like proprotein convertase family protein